MDRKEQRDFEHRNEREKDKKQHKLHDDEVERLDKKGWGAPRPFALIVIGTALTLLIVLGWILFVP